MKLSAQCASREVSHRAVFWFYLGQLRYRAYLRAHPDLDPSGEPALFASLMATIGPPINRYAFDDIEVLRATIDKVLAWDDAHRDAHTPKDRYATERRQVREGLRDLSAKIENGSIGTDRE